MILAFPVLSNFLMFRGVNIQPYPQLFGVKTMVSGGWPILRTSDLVGDLQLDVGKHVGLVVAGTANQPG